MAGQPTQGNRPALRVVADNGCFWVLNVGLVALTDVEVRVCERGQTTLLPQLSASELEPLEQPGLEVNEAPATGRNLHFEATWRDDAGHEHRLEVDLPGDGEGHRRDRVAPEPAIA